MIKINNEDLLQLLSDYEARNQNHSFEGFHRLTIYLDGSGSLKGPNDEIVFEFENDAELEEKLKTCAGYQLIDKGF